MADPRQQMLADLKVEAEQLTKYHRELSQRQGQGAVAPGAEVTNSKNTALTNTDDIVTQLSKMEGERSQLLEWGESLYKEVARLEKENERLEGDVRNERSEAAELKDTNTVLTQKCVVLENALKDPSGRAATNSKDLLAGAATESVTAAEQSDLRKKLSASAAEIESLRKQNAAAMDALRQAQQASQQRVLERDSYFLTVEELENNFQRLQEKYTLAEGTLQNANETKKNLEDRLHESALELDVMCASLKLARREAETHVLRLEGMERASKEKHELIAHLKEMIEPLQSTFMKMQQSYAQQTKEYSAFVEEVHTRQKDAHDSLETAKNEILVLETVTERLRTELVQMKAEFAKNHSSLQEQLEAEKEGRTQQQQELDLVRAEWEKERQATDLLISEKREQLTSLKTTLNNMSERRTGKPKNAKDTNFAKEVTLGKLGVTMEKIGSAKAKDETKSTKVVTIDVSTGTMSYKKSSGMFGGGTTSVALTDVIHFEWGLSSRAYVVASKKGLYKPGSLKPWLCISIYTKDRSFDFIVVDDKAQTGEEALRTVVLSLSAACVNCSGMMKTRGQFILKKAMMKIDDQCRWKNVTRGALVYAALEKTAADDGMPMPPRPQKRPSAVGTSRR